MNSDLTFITNEENKNLSERFKVLIQDTRLFDVLAGYFYTSGFHTIYKSLENTEKIRILIGISTNRQAIELIQKAKDNHRSTLPYSHVEVKKQIENSEDRTEVEGGILKFIEWLKNGKLEIKAYPTENIHAKLYIMTFVEGDRDIGMVITGSSNFTQAGLSDNFEFNVELKNPEDYKFALQKFNELWKDAVAVGERHIDIIQIKTWLNNTITPYSIIQ
jgi:HKD family nuclease